MSLDDVQSIASLDKSNARGSIEMIPLQIKSAWEDSFKIDFPEKFSKAQNIVIAGMGGSAYGAHIAKSLFDLTCPVPIFLANGYRLPEFVDSRTLVILCSYSGSTEETISCASQAKERTSLISAVTSGGKLTDFLHSNDFPAYIFNPEFNPSNQPRIGVGYMVTGLIGLLSRLKYINLQTEEVMATVVFLKEYGKSLIPSHETTHNDAKKLTGIIHQSIPVFISADFLEGATHAIRNPIHETGKQFGLNFTVPELNHHLLEGLQFPDFLKQDLKIIFIQSKLYEKRNQKRINLTYDVVKKNGINTQNISLKSQTRFSQTMELIQFGGWLTFYMAILNGIDPSPVHWVDYFKSELLK